MKIVCDSCGAKYSIADEKVRGKVFKIRCKKCSEVIVVRGDGSSDGTAKTAAPASAAGGDTIWHLVVSGEQQGPFSPEQISQMLSAGQIDWEAYGWRDGLENWVHLREIEELVTAITGQAPPAIEAAAIPERTPAPASADIFAGAAAAGGASAELFSGGGGGGGGMAVASGGGGMFASAAASGTPLPAARAPAASTRGARPAAADLFGGAADDEDVVSSKSQPPDASGSMTGARSENSVLFSLSNLQALATKGQASSAPSGGAPKAGFAGGGGSGLIDIRALAEGGTSPSSSGSSSKGGIDDLLSIGGSSAFAPTLGAPVLVPARSEGGKLLYVLLGVAALLVLGIIGLVIVIMTKDEGQTQVAAAPPPVVSPSAAPAAAPNAPPTPAGSALPAPSPNEQPAPTDGEAGSSAGGDARRAGGRTAGGGGGRTTGAAAAPSSPTAPTKQETAAPTKRPDSRTADLDALIGSAIGERQATKAPAPDAPAAAARSGGPATPSRGDVSSAMAAVRPAVSACAGGQSGTAAIRIVFAGSGRVTTASVTSPPFAGTPAGSCMARAVRQARVPPFSNPSLTVTFPFVVR